MEKVKLLAHTFLSLFRNLQICVRLVKYSRSDLVGSSSNLWCEEVEKVKEVYRSKLKIR